ncbi:hypothetical protein ACSQ67_005854 [Phaseolus vulgaris]
MPNTSKKNRIGAADGEENNRRGQRRCEWHDSVNEDFIEFADASEATVFQVKMLYVHNYDADLNSDNGTVVMVSIGVPEH